MNHSLGVLGWCKEETAAATHSLSCGVPDRESTEKRYLKEATELTPSGRSYFKEHRQ